MINFSSTIIFVIDKDRVAVFESVCDPPISIHGHRPAPRHFTLERVPAPTGQIHIIRQFGRIQCTQLHPQLFDVGRLDSSFRYEAQSY